MSISLIVWVIIGIVILLWFVLKKKKGNQRDYSLGLKIAEDIQAFIKNKTYSEAEALIEKADVNDITQVVDHLALSLKEEDIVAWKKSSNSDFSKISLGVFYIHLAWISRSHQLAKDVSESSAESFHKYLLLCDGEFSELSESSIFQSEMYSRMIRLQMSLNDTSLATDYFTQVTEASPDLIWPYIHYAEMIQPKWGAELQELEVFYESLPANFLIKSIVELKLILDSIGCDDNYFKKYNGNIKAFAAEKIKLIDTESQNADLSSIHRYILFNYMWALSDSIGNKPLLKKYAKLVGGNFTIYPFGLAQ